MTWADYRQGAKKAKVHRGYDVRKSIPHKMILTDGKADERLYVKDLVAPGQTAVLDCYDQWHKKFDDRQEQGRHFACRIKASSRKTVRYEILLVEGNHVFYDAVVLLGTQGVNQTRRKVRVVGYQAEGKPYWVATDRWDLSAEDTARIYKLRWTIESFFACCQQIELSGFVANELSTFA